MSSRHADDQRQLERQRRAQEARASPFQRPAPRPSAPAASNPKPTIAGPRNREGTRSERKTGSAWSSTASAGPCNPAERAPDQRDEDGQIDPPLAPAAVARKDGDQDAGQHERDRDHPHVVVVLGPDIAVPEHPPRVRAGRPERKDLAEAEPVVERLESRVLAQVVKRRQEAHRRQQHEQQRDHRQRTRHPAPIVRRSEPRQTLDPQRDRHQRRRVGPPSSTVTAKSPATTTL